MTTDLDTDTRLALLGWLLAGRRLEHAARSLGITFADAKATAISHGWPDVNSMTRASEALTKKTRLPRREEEETPAMDTIELLLDDVRMHDVPKIKAAGARVEKALADLRALIADDAQNRKVREEIKALEQQLAQAKQRLKGPVAKTPSGGGSAYVKQTVRLERLGATRDEVKRWMQDNGHEVTPSPLFRADVLDAFEASRG